MSFLPVCVIVCIYDYMCVYVHVFQWRNLVFIWGDVKGGGEGADLLLGGLEDGIAMMFPHHISCAQS